MPNDEFDLLLERCRENLSEIKLSVPAIESIAPRAPTYSLAPEVVAPPKPVVPAKLAAPTPRLEKPHPLPPEPELPKPALEPMAAPIPASKPTAPPATQPSPEESRAQEREDSDVFPPLHLRPTPPPPVPLWRAQDVPTTKSGSAPESMGDSSSGPALGGRRRTAAASAAAAVVAVGAFSAWLARRPAADLDVDVSDTDAMAVRPDKGDLLIAQGKDLVDISGDGRTLERRTLDAPVESLCWEQGSLWSADGRTSAVTERADGGRATVFRLNHVPGAIYVKDKYLWTSEKGGNVLHQFLISRSILGALLQPLDSFELSGLSPETFTFDDADTLWLVDAPSRRLYSLRLDNGSYKRTSSAPLSPFLGPEGKLRGLTIEKGSVWILSQPGHGGRAALRRIALSHLDWTPA